MRLALETHWCLSETMTYSHPLSPSVISSPMRPTTAAYIPPQPVKTAVCTTLILLVHSLVHLFVWHQLTFNLLTLQLLRRYSIIIIIIIINTFLSVLLTKSSQMGASQFVPMSSRTMPTSTQVNSYPIPRRTQVYSYPIPTRTQLVPKSQLTRTQRRTYRLVALVWHTNWSQPIHSMESFCKLYNLSKMTHNW